MKSKIGEKILLVLICSILLFYLVKRLQDFYYMELFEFPFFRVLENNDFIMEKGETKWIQINSFRADTVLSYSSNDFKIVQVTPGGKVYARKRGIAVITIKLKGGKTCRCRIRVIELNNTKIQIKVGKRKYLSVKGKPLFSIVRWKSSDKKVVTVNRFGMIKAKKEGKATITATVKGKKLKCMVKCE